MLPVYIFIKLLTKCHIKHENIDRNMFSRLRKTVELEDMRSL